MFLQLADGRANMHEVISTLNRHRPSLDAFTCSFFTIHPRKWERRAVPGRAGDP
jgi:hypothetical protein